MQPINLNRRHLSRAVWETVLECAVAFESQDRPRLESETVSLDALRRRAEYNTGSITAATCWALFALSAYLKPRVVAEVGTFIGRSTLSFVRGIERADVPGALVVTCDLSNDIELPFSSSVKVRQFRKRSSTDMFATMIAEGIKCDFLALDGRLQPDDFQMLGSVLTPNSVFVLDDFEGVEKGVVNAAALMSSLQPTHNLIYPPTPEMLAKFGLTDGCTTALIAPRSAFQFSNQ
jgi:hypothetical protein